ncbi:hypothetical protein CDAR_97741 [Caerostris darwini]|uniref:Uncharacterized protein n=1 Tax=Caerostris darwini TaxID=1538125 RepID=A0AAV4SWK7_9ARAC|nr:hypothetical protein CDAR_97741 [Caerostris darwini]
MQIYSISFYCLHAILIHLQSETLFVWADSFPYPLHPIEFYQKLFEQQKRKWKKRMERNEFTEEAPPTFTFKTRTIPMESRSLSRKTDPPDLSRAFVPSQ